MRISRKDERKLHTLSLGRCNACSSSVYSYGIYTGENAHIIPYSFAGPRGGAEPATSIGSYENHILLCEPHHKLIDDNPDIFKVDIILRIKREHEAFIKSCVDMSPIRKNISDFLTTFFKYSSLYSINYFFYLSPHSIKTDCLDIIDASDNTIEVFPFVYPFRDIELKYHYDNLIEQFHQLSVILKGSHFVNRPIDHYISNYDGTIIFINRDLSDEYRNIIENKVSFFVDGCIRSFQNLGEYVRLNYPEVRI